MIRPHDTITSAIRDSMAAGRPAIVGFMTAGFPTKEGFASNLLAIGNEADVVEIGVPFSDPMADGMTIQRSSQVALAQHVSLHWILDQLQGLQQRPRAPLVLMSYLNPLLAYGLHRLPRDAHAAGIAGFIVPDLPFEESAETRRAFATEGLALVQMVTPVTPEARIRMLADHSHGFVYAVTMTGVTGKSATVPAGVIDYLERVRKVSPLPVCAGFGIRTRAQVDLMRGHVDGVIVGSALVEVLERGEDPAAFLHALR